MIDTLRLTAPELTSEALKQHESWSGDTCLLSGEVKSQKAVIYLNAQKTEQDQLVYNGTMKLVYDHQKKYLNIGLSSAPVLLYGTSFVTLQRKDITRLKEEMQKQIDCFVDIDITKTVITRLDNSELYRMNTLCSHYIMLLDSITRSKQHHAKKNFFENETIEFRNNQRITKFYDKYAKNEKNTLELQNAGLLGMQSNELRYEITNRHSRSIKHAFKLTEPLTFTQLDTDYMQAALHKQRIKEFHKHFRFVTSQDKARLEDFLNSAIFMKARHKRTALDKTLWYLAIEKGFISLTELKAIMRAAGYPRQTVHRRIKSLTELLAHDIETTQLYEELKAKVEAA